MQLGTPIKTPAVVGITAKKEQILRHARLFGIYFVQTFFKQKWGFQLILKRKTLFPAHLLYWPRVLNRRRNSGKPKTRKRSRLELLVAIIRTPTNGPA